MQSELTSVRTRIDAMVSEIGQMPAAEQEARSAQVAEMKSMADDLTARIDRLKVECPADWSAEKAEIDTNRRKLQEKVDLWDAAHIAGGYVGG